MRRRGQRPIALCMLALASGCVLTTSFEGLSRKAAADAGSVVPVDAMVAPDDAMVAPDDAAPAEASVVDAEERPESGSGDAGVVLVGATSGSIDDSLLHGLAEVFVYTASASGVARHISVYLRSGTTVGGLRAGIYEDVSNVATTLLATATLGVAAAPGWTTGELSPPRSIEAGKRYWLALLSDGTVGELKFRSTAAGLTSFGHDGTGLTALPATWKNGTSFPNSPAAIYVTN